VTFTDAHVHFWDQGTLPYPWLATVPAIAGRHTPGELRAESAAAVPQRIVFVECGAPWLDEVKWVEQLAAHEPRIAGIVAKIAVDAGTQTTTALAELKRHPLVRGVRHIIQDEPDPNFCLRPEFVAGVSQLGAAGLSFDLCCRHHQLAAVIELVRRCPQTSFVLDHAGKPGIRDGLLDPWRAHIRALSALPNIVCKLSGLVTEADPERWTSEQLRPYVAQLLDTFGPPRLLFGGDWPVVKLASTYARWLETAQALLESLSPAETAAIFHHNATKTYRLP
jgi:L-fuconolactonase